jgi:two-component system CheB/CheR fusion protein
MTEAADTTHLPRIIGIGASAGGLEALEQLFGAVPNNTGLAFVVIQHLSPDFKSLMTELLARRTKMTIKRVDTEEDILPNHVYLIPPKKLLELRDDKIVTAEFDHTASPPRAIDHFFMSLARSQGKDSVGIILSGTGSDGTAGAAAIREVGGTVIAQDPETCKFDGMPSSVIRKGLAQECLSPEDIAQYLASDRGDKSTADRTLESSVFDNKRHLLAELLTLLEESEGIDFKNYRTTTLTRRIERRMQSGRFPSLEAYIEFVRNDADERLELQNEFLIGVTRFFRDEGAFDDLRNTVIPEIVDRNDGQTIRMWVAGCSTGEEAVTLAILFWDYLQLRGKHCEVKIFATDVDRKAIEFASVAKYSESQIIDIPPESKRAHFNRIGEIYELKPHIRRMIIYSHHNVIKDPPFTKLDLLSCRNLLIYFQPPLQERCISLFLFALKQRGVLFLGKSEAIGVLSSEFETLSSAHKIFRKHSDAGTSLLSEIRSPAPLLHSVNSRTSRHSSTFGHMSFVRDSQITRAYEILLDQYVPPCLLMDDKDQLIHVFGAAGDLLRIPPGKTTLDVMKLLPKEFSLALRSASTLAISSQNEVALKDVEAEGSTPGEIGEKQLYTLRVRPLDWHDTKSGKPMLVFFDKQESKSKSDDTQQAVGKQSPQAIVSYQWNQQTQEHIQSLEDHLKSTRETLQTAIEELETTNEELQSTNEELMSSNEELQSSNEELHSVNEELYTVNTEYQNKIEELSRANLDIDFLLKTSRIGVIFLGHDLRVRRFNENVREMISLMPHDIGRPITDLQFNYANREIIDAVQSVSRSGSMLQFEMPSRGGTQLVTISHYATLGDGPYVAESHGNDNLAGIVISFVDITPSKMSEIARQKHAYSEALNTQLLSEIRRIVHVGPTENALQLGDLKRKISLIGQMVEKSLERKRISQSNERTDLVNSTEAVRRILDLVPGSTNIKIHGKMPQIVTPIEIFEDILLVICRNVTRIAATRGADVLLESSIEDARCCFDFTSKVNLFDDLEMRSIFALYETPLQNEPLVEMGLGTARLNSQLIGGRLEVIQRPEYPHSILRLSLPGLVSPISASPMQTPSVHTLPNPKGNGGIS